MANRPDARFPTNIKDYWVVGLAVFLPLLAFSSCSTRGTEFGPMQSGYLILVGLSIAITLLCAWLVRSSILGVILFLIYGAALTVTPELYWSPKDRAFQDRVSKVEKSSQPYNFSESRPWSCSDYDLVYEEGVIFVMD